METALPLALGLRAKGAARWLRRAAWIAAILGGMWISVNERTSEIGIGAALTWAVPAVSLSIAPAYVVAALAVSLAAGLAGGVLPARRAARLDPLEALRAE